MRVHEIVASGLAAHRIEVVFGLMGDGNLLYVTDFIRDHNGRFVACAFEGSGVSMADGYSRASGRIGVASVTHGPAFTNTLTQLVEAVRNRSRVLLITGSAPDAAGHLQQFDIEGMARLAGAGYDRIHSAATAEQDTLRALDRVVAEGRPIVLNVPDRLLRHEAEPAGLRPAQPMSRPGPDVETLDSALGLALSARRPVVLAGRGAVESGAREALVELAEAIGAPLATTLLAKDYFQGHPSNIGICGTLSTGLATGTVAESDCVLVFGASLNSFTTDGGALLGRKQRIVRVDVRPELGNGKAPVEVHLCGDARITAEAMVARLREADESDVPTRELAVRSELANSDYEDFGDVSTDVTVDLRTALIRLDDILPKRRAVVTDTGRFMSAAFKYLHVDHPLGFTHTASFGSIGLGLSTALGVAVADPGKCTVAVLGDGGFMMGAQELHTVVRNSLPMVLVIANDGAYGAEWRKLDHYGVDPNYSRSVWPDFVDMARGVGMDGATVHNLAALEDLRGRFDGLERPFLIDLRLDAAQDIRY